MCPHLCVRRLPCARVEPAPRRRAGAQGPPEAGGPGRPRLAPAWLRPEPQPRCVLRGGRLSPSPLAVDGRAAVKRHAGRCAASATGASPLAMCSAALTLQPPSKERNGVAPCARSHLLLRGGGAFALQTVALEETPAPWSRVPSPPNFLTPSGAASGREAVPFGLGRQSSALVQNRSRRPSCPRKENGLQRGRVHAKPVCASAGRRGRPSIGPQCPARAPCQCGARCPSHGYRTLSSATCDSMRLSVELVCIVLAELIHLFSFIFCFSVKLLSNIRRMSETVTFDFNVP